ncbi:MAG: hypothetical protein A2162_01520 [Deltaproteobacteria bacterium RBG_13_52_11b]|nr:MAG: hypothetical protein A2162_01520 [Deltaproteobacteria bacterium RBG_13_52_11b]
MVAQGKDHGSQLERESLCPLRISGHLEGSLMIEGIYGNKDDIFMYGSLLGRLNAKSAIFLKIPFQRGGYHEQD